MTVNDTLAAIEVMKAFTEGKQIEIRGRDSSNEKWVPMEACWPPSWDWEVFEYRVKVEPPKPQEFFVVVDVRSNSPVTACKTYNSAEAYRTDYGVNVTRTVRAVEVPS